MEEENAHTKRIEIEAGKKNSFCEKTGLLQANMLEMH